MPTSRDAGISARTNFASNWNWALAGAMFNAVPIILLVIFLQKYFIRSAPSSPVKG